jgi:hypothetical protein
MGELNSKGLVERIKTIEKRVKSDGEIFSRGIALNEIVEFCGWTPDSYSGKLIGLGIDWVITSMVGNIRKNGEPYSQHCIMTMKYISDLCSGKINDVTLALGALNHDNIEELSSYRKNKKDFRSAKDDAERERISGDIEKVKQEYNEKRLSFLSSLHPNLIPPSKLDADSLFEIEVGLTKKPNEYYHEYLEKIFGRKSDCMSDTPDLNTLRMAIIKAADRRHNNSTVSRQDDYKQKDGFTISQRLKECYKSLMVVNRTGNFMIDFPFVPAEYSQYMNCLGESKQKLIDVGKSVLSEDIAYLSSIIEERKRIVIDSLFRSYDDYMIRKPATENDIVKDERKVFDGTLARFDSWVKTHMGKSIEPDNIRLNPANKRWMKEWLGITDPNMRIAVQEYMDSLVFRAVFERFERYLDYTLRGFGNIND